MADKFCILSAAQEIVRKTELEGAYSNILLPKYAAKNSLNGENRAALWLLVRGCIENRLTIEYNLSLYLKKPHTLPNGVYYTLKCAAFELLFTERPSYAVVNDAVEFVREKGYQGFSSLTNAVLRKIAANGSLLPDNKNKLQYLSIKHSVSPEVLTKLLNSLGEEKTIAFLDSAKFDSGIFVRLNDRKTTRELFENDLTESGIGFIRYDIPPFCYKITSNASAITETEAASKGHYFVQDRSSQMCSLALRPEKAEIIADFCAAPGGKTFAAALLAPPDARILSFDVHSNKLSLIKNSAQKLGLENIEVQAADAREIRLETPTDRIICDVPCSGLGVIGRKPEIRYKKDFDSLPDLQYSIVSNCARSLAPGGLLIYSTCTVIKEENEQVVERLLNENNTLSLDTGTVLDESGMMTFLPPFFDGDGFFAAAIRKTA